MTAHEHEQLPERIATLEAEMVALQRDVTRIGDNVVHLYGEIKPALQEVALQGQAIKDLQGRPGVWATWIVAVASVLMALGAVGYTVHRPAPPTPPSAVEIAQELSRLQAPQVRP